MRMVFCVDILREKICSTIAFTNVWHFVTSDTVKANINKLLSLIYESCKTCELLFWFRKFTKCSVEYQLGIQQLGIQWKLTRQRKAIH